MGEQSKIEWTDHTFNGWIGCQKVSPGCDFCYAEDMMDKRYRRVQWGPHGARVRTSKSNWQKPRTWAETGGRQIPANIWLGVSCEDQARANHRVPILLEAAMKLDVRVTFVSAEPLLGPINFRSIACLKCGGHHDALKPYAVFGGRTGPALSWIIVGGESGPGARPMQRPWLDSVIHQCRSAGVAVFVKQLGAAFSDEKNGIAGAALDVPAEVRDIISRRLRNKKGGDTTEWPQELRVQEWPNAT